LPFWNSFELCEAGTELREVLEWLNLITFYSFLYSVALALAVLASLPYWLFQMLRHGKYHKGLRERIGAVPRRLRLPADHESVIWIHAVSVGEVLAILGLAKELQRRWPRRNLFISTVTDTGQTLARKHFGEDRVFYFPMDFAFAIRPYLRALRPELVIVAETEFWPNFMRMARANGARIAVVNARISDRSWPRYRRFRSLIGKALAHVELFLARTPEDAQRLRAIGAYPERIRVTGNLKFDMAAPAPPTILNSLRKSITATCTGPVLVCGSTVEGEEPLLLKAFEDVVKKYPKALMILGPRHPERFPAVAALLKQASVRFYKRSDWQEQSLAGGVLLLDSIGELAAIYSLADVAFVGGSLVARGGHNIIEPAQHGVAIVVGEHTENFRDIVSLFQKRDAVRIAVPKELSAVFLELLAKDEERKTLGRRAADTVQSQTGATARTADSIEELLAR
jgi:3-deoxy-D-manno-octulosonic-acid transferase